MNIALRMVSFIAIKSSKSSLSKNFSSSFIIIVFDVKELRALALQTLELCRKKKELLKKLESELKDFDGI